MEKESFFEKIFTTSENNSEEDWLAKQKAEEAGLQTTESAMAKLKKLHSKSCDAEMLKKDLKRKKRRE